MEVTLAQDDEDNGAVKARLTAAVKRKAAPEAAAVDEDEDDDVAVEGLLLLGQSAVLGALHSNIKVEPDREDHLEQRPLLRGSSSSLSSMQSSSSLAASKTRQGAASVSLPPFRGRRSDLNAVANFGSLGPTALCRRYSYCSSDPGLDEEGATTSNNYQKMRERNNEASKRCRLKRRLKAKTMEQQAQYLAVHNTWLKQRLVHLEGIRKVLTDGVRQFRASKGAAGCAHSCAALASVVKLKQETMVQSCALSDSDLLRSSKLSRQSALFEPASRPPPAQQPSGLPGCSGTPSGPKLCRMMAPGSGVVEKASNQQAIALTALDVLNDTIVKSLVDPLVPHASGAFGVAPLSEPKDSKNSPKRFAIIVRSTFGGVTVVDQSQSSGPVSPIQAPTIGPKCHLPEPRAAISDPKVKTQSDDKKIQPPSPKASAEKRFRLEPFGKQNQGDLDEAASDQWCKRGLDRTDPKASSNSVFKSGSLLKKGVQAVHLAPVPKLKPHYEPSAQPPPTTSILAKIGKLNEALTCINPNVKPIGFSITSIDSCSPSVLQDATEAAEAAFLTLLSVIAPGQEGHLWNKVKGKVDEKLSFDGQNNGCKLHREEKIFDKRDPDVKPKS